MKPGNPVTRSVIGAGSCRVARPLRPCDLGREMSREESAETKDASRRTWLALERTQLAWWRTGLTALAVGIGIGRVVPELQESERSGRCARGVAFAIYGIALIVYGSARERYLAADLERGANRLSHASFDVLLAGFGAALGIATALLIAFA